MSIAALAGPFFAKLVFCHTFLGLFFFLSLLCLKLSGIVVVCMYSSIRKKAKKEKAIHFFFKTDRQTDISQSQKRSAMRLARDGLEEKKKKKKKTTKKTFPIGVSSSSSSSSILTSSSSELILAGNWLKKGATRILCSCWWLLATRSDERPS